MPFIAASVRFASCDRGLYRADLQLNQIQRMLVAERGQND